EPRGVPPRVVERRASQRAGLLAEGRLRVDQISCDAEVVVDRLACDEEPHDLRESEEHTSELQSRENLVCRLLLEKKKLNTNYTICICTLMSFAATVSSELNALSLHDALPI